MSPVTANGALVAKYHAFAGGNGLDGAAAGAGPRLAEAKFSAVRKLDLVAVVWVAKDCAAGAADELLRCSGVGACSPKYL